MRKGLTTEQAQAIQHFAAEWGRRWKSELRDAWAASDVRSIGTVLYGLRNTHGPAWLAAFRFDVLDCK